MNVLKKTNLVFMAAALLLCTACDENIVPTTPVATDAGASTTTTTLATTINGLPIDNGGTHVPYVLGSTAASYGYYLYTPGGYQSTTAKYPLLIFLHGQTERGDGTNSLTVLNKVLATGIPKLIKDKKWNPTNPMLVVSPQYYGTTGVLSSWGGGKPAPLKAFIEYMISHYRVDPRRIYLTGLSYGGNGIWDYLAQQDDATSLIAAAAPISAWGAKYGYSKCKNTPIWSFVGKNDVNNFNATVKFVNSYNAQVPAPKYSAKISAYPNVGHNAWTRTYDGTGMGTADPLYNPFNQVLFDWFYRYKRPKT